MRFTGDVENMLYRQFYLLRVWKLVVKSFRQTDRQTEVLSVIIEKKRGPIRSIYHICFFKCSLDRQTDRQTHRQTDRQLFILSYFRNN